MGVVGDGPAVTTTKTCSHFGSKFGLTATPLEHIRLPVWLTRSNAPVHQEPILLPTPGMEGVEVPNRGRDRTWPCCTCGAKSMRQCSNGACRHHACELHLLAVSGAKHRLCACCFQPQANGAIHGGKVQDASQGQIDAFGTGFFHV